MNQYRDFIKSSKALHHVFFTLCQGVDMGLQIEFLQCITLRKPPENKKAEFGI